jgi:hypothetical protein
MTVVDRFDCQADATCGEPVMGACVAEAQAVALQWFGAP